MASIFVQGPDVCFVYAKECNVQKKLKKKLNTGVVVITVFKLKDLVQLHWIIDVTYVHRAYKHTKDALKWCDIWLNCKRQKRLKGRAVWEPKEPEFPSPAWCWWLYSKTLPGFDQAACFWGAQCRNLPLYTGVEPKRDMGSPDDFRAILYQTDGGWAGGGKALPVARRSECCSVVAGISVWRYDCLLWENGHDWSAGGKKTLIRSAGCQLRLMTAWTYFIIMQNLVKQQ